MAKAVDRIVKSLTKNDVWWTLRHTGLCATWTRHVANRRAGRRFSLDPLSTVVRVHFYGSSQKCSLEVDGQEARLSKADNAKLVAVCAQLLGQQRGRDSREAYRRLAKLDI